MIVCMSPNNSSGAPLVTEMQVIPVAGHDSMLLNLSGAHSPCFTRNLVILKDNAGHTGVGEVPGGERIRQTLEDSKSLVLGQSIAAYNSILNGVRQRFADRDAGERRNSLVRLRRLFAFPSAAAGRPAIPCGSARSVPTTWAY